MARKNPSVGPSHGLHHHPSLSLPEAATQTWKRGAILVDNGSGYLGEAAANPVDIIGIAMDAGQNGTAAGDKTARVAVPGPHCTFEMSLDSAGGLGRATVQGDLFEKYGITKDGDGRWYVDVDKTGANARVVVVGFKDAVGTASGVVYVQFLAGTTIYG